AGWRIAQENERLAIPRPSDARRCHLRNRTFVSPISIDQAQFAVDSIGQRFTVGRPRMLQSVLRCHEMEARAVQLCDAKPTSVVIAHMHRVGRQGNSKWDIVLYQLTPRTVRIYFV